ncbi:hypothetical protein O9929_26455 [Vibrio lentus]|nr:hypothetical protein [Vibrio lentus]
MKHLYEEDAKKERYLRGCHDFIFEQLMLKSRIRNSHFKGNMACCDAGANIATESDEACIGYKNPGKNSRCHFRSQWYWFRARSGHQVSFDAYANIGYQHESLDPTW